MTSPPAHSNPMANELFRILRNVTFPPSSQDRYALLVKTVPKLCTYRDSQGCTLLHLACMRGLSRLTRELVINTNVQSTDLCGSTPLHYAAGYAYGGDSGHLECVHILLECGASLDAVDSFGRTALWCGASGGSIDVVRFLVGRGALVGLRGRSLWEEVPVTPKEVAKRHEDGPIVEFLEWVGSF